MSSSTIALISLIAASLLWSTAGVTTKILLQTFDPFPLAFLRFTIASLVLLPFFLIKSRPTLKNWYKELIPVAIMGTGNIIFFYLGLTRTTVNASIIIYTAQPLITAILASHLLAETITSRKIQGILVGLVGILVIVLLPLWERGEIVSGDLLGNLLIFIAVWCWSFYTVGSRYLINQKHYPVTTVTGGSILVSAAIFLLFTLFLPHRNFVAPLLQIQPLLLLIHLSLLVTVATLLLYQWAIKHSSATTASLTSYLQPVFGITLAIVILGEKITIGFVIGSLLVVLGVFLATGARLSQKLRGVWMRFMG